MLHFNPVTGTLVEKVTVHAYNQTFELNLPMTEHDECGGTLLHLVKGQTAGKWHGKELGDGTGLFETFGFYNENVTFVEELLAGGGGLGSGSLETALQSVEVAACIRLRKRQYNAEGN